MRLMLLLWHRSDVQRVRVPEKGDHVSAYCTRSCTRENKNSPQKDRSGTSFLGRVRFEEWSILILQREFKNPSKQQQKTVLNNETNTRYGA
jgi:hypothetical protein